MELLAELWQRAITVQPAPQPWIVAALGLGALAAVLFAWPLTRMLVTIIHEAGHAIVAVLAGRRLTGIRLHSDTSGLTVSRGRASGFGMVATLSAGYPAPALVGLGAAYLLASGYSVGLLWAWVMLLAVMLLFMRNLYGLLTVLTVGGAVGAASWYLEPVYQSWLAYLLTWILLLAAIRPVVELARSRGTSSDSAQLARLTRLPAICWTALFSVVCIGCLALGVLVLAPGVLGTLQQ